MLFCELKAYLSSQGWFNSIQTGMSVDNEGAPIPYYTYSSIHFLATKINCDMKVFEYGSGNSTLWWSQRVTTLVSCEHDPAWFQKCQEKMPDTVDYRLHEEAKDYTNTILEFKDTFDVIVIDGRHRVNCAENAVLALKNEGVVVWDNSDRTEYQAGYDYLKEKDFKRFDFWGLGPLNSYQWCTSLFYRTKNCMGI